jgi:integrase
MEAKFFLRKQVKSDMYPITLAVFDRRFTDRKFYYSTREYIEPSKWQIPKKKDGKSEKYGFPKDKYSPTAKLLQGLQDIVRTWGEQQVGKSKLSREDLQKALKGYRKEEEKQEEKKLQDESDFFKTWQRIIEESKGKNGGKIVYNTRLSKNQTLNLVTKYCRTKNVKLTFETIDMLFYYNFSAFMEEEGLSDNSRGKHFKEIKSILREAQDRDITVNTSYTKKSFKVIRKDADNVYLTEDEIKTLLSLKLTNGKERVRDLFLMACYVGVRHSDWSQIRKANMVDDKFLKIRQTKTGDTIHVPVHPVVRLLLNKYNGEPPRVISNQKCNETLKEIFQHEDLQKDTELLKGLRAKAGRISTHTARRSFATNAYLSKSMNTYSIMACTGHKTEASFLKYLKLSGLDKAQDIAESKFFSDEGWSTLKIAL